MNDSINRIRLSSSKILSDNLCEHLKLDHKYGYIEKLVADIVQEIDESLPPQCQSERLKITVTCDVIPRKEDYDEQP